jgi:hypothetical protein
MYSFISKSIKRGFNFALAFSAGGIALSIQIYGWTAIFTSIYTVGIPFFITYLMASLLVDYILPTEK